MSLLMVLLMTALAAVNLWAWWRLGKLLNLVVGIACVPTALLWFTRLVGWL